MLYFSGKGCSEFPKKVLILIGILTLSWPPTSEEAADLTEEQFQYLMLGLNPLNPKIKDVTPQKPG